MADIRPMRLDQVAAARGVIDAANTQRERQAGRAPQTRSDEQYEQQLSGLRRFVERAEDGAWVAEQGGRVVGVAAAIRRGAFWGLSLLFVDPAHQNAGLGRRLLEEATSCAAGAELRMILATADPRALRRYSGAGLAIHPTVEATGAVDRSAIPGKLDGRPGDSSDLELIASVDAHLRGSRVEDVAYLLDAGARLEVLDRETASGWVLARDGRLLMLGATDEATASLLLWRFLANAGEEVEIWSLSAQQDWAVKVALAARLEVRSAGALFIAGRELPPGPWLPSGLYF